MTQKEFDSQFTKALMNITEAMAESQEIDPAKFYSMVCILENMRFFSPVLYGALLNPTEE